MRTTVDLPEDLHSLALTIARSRRQSLSQTIADMMRGWLAQTPESRPLEISPLTGLPVIHLGRRTTMEDVKRLEDDE